MTEKTNKANKTEERQSSLEELFEGLDEVISALEGDTLTLEESFTLYQKGMNMLKECGKSIDMVEKKVQILDENGETHDF